MSLPIDRPPTTVAPDRLPDPRPARPSAAAVARTWPATVEFRGALRTYVLDLRARGVPPERMLVHVKELLDADPRTARHGHGELGADLHAQLVSWSIEDYYREQRAD